MYLPSTCPRCEYRRALLWFPRDGSISRGVLNTWAKFIPFKIALPYPGLELSCAISRIEAGSETDKSVKSRYRRKSASVGPFCAECSLHKSHKITIAHGADAARDEATETDNLLRNVRWNMIGFLSNGSMLIRKLSFQFDINFCHYEYHLIAVPLLCVYTCLIGPYIFQCIALDLHAW